MKHHLLIDSQGKDEFMLTRSIAVALIAAPFVFAQNVHIVDATGGSGSFADVAPAIESASDGDIIVIKAGTYSGFTVSAKSLSITADRDASVFIDGTVEIRDLGAEGSTSIYGLQTSEAQLGLDGLIIADCAGLVTVESCTFHGEDQGPPVQSYAHGGGGAIVRASSAVTFVRCTLTGGLGYWHEGFGGSGGNGLFTYESNVAVYSSILTGGDASYHQDYAGDGGHGAHAYMSFLFVADSRFTGGEGGYSYAEYELDCECWECGHPGSGGAPLLVVGGDVVSRTCSFEAGEGGTSTPHNCYQGHKFASEVSTQDEAISTELAPSLRRQIEATTPTREFDSVGLEIVGNPGEFVQLILSTEPGHVWVPALSGMLLVSPTSFAVIPVQALTSTSMELTLPVPALPAGFEGIVFELQATFSDSGDVTLGGPAEVVLLSRLF